MANGRRVAGIHTYTLGPPILFSSELVDGSGTALNWPVYVPGERETLGEVGALTQTAPQAAILESCRICATPLYTYGNINALPGTRSCPYYDEDVSFQNLRSIRRFVDRLSRRETTRRERNRVRGIYARRFIEELRSGIKIIGRFPRVRFVPMIGQRNRAGLRKTNESL
jgi:hypothetical protein